MIKINKRVVNWTPREGIYQCVLPKGTVHITLYPEGNTAIPTALTFGMEVELRNKEIRILKRSGILIDGILTPLRYFEKNEKGKEIEVDAGEDPLNPNLVSEGALYTKVQEMTNAVEFKELLDRITSELTIKRYGDACNLLDTPQSYTKAVEDRLFELKSEKEENPETINEQRKKFLTPKISR